MNHPDLKPRLTRSRRNTPRRLQTSYQHAPSLCSHAERIKGIVCIFILACVGESNYVLLDEMGLCTRDLAAVVFQNLI